MRSTLSAPIPTPEKSIQRSRRLALHRIRKALGPRVFLILVSIIFLIPLYWMVVIAFKSNPELAQVPPTLLPQSWQWQNFGKALSTFPFGTYFLNSAIITILNVIGAVLSSLIVAYGFACIQWPGRNTVFYLVLATIFIPFPLALIPLFDLFAWLHWINTYLPLVVPSFFGSAFFIFLLRQFLLQIPRDLLDAARVDGASEWRILWQVVAPLARPAMAAVAIFAGVNAWNDFLGPLIYLQDSSVQTLSIGLQTFRSTHDVQFNLLMATTIMVVLPLVVLFLIFQRFFIRGITLGSIR